MYNDRHDVRCHRILSRAMARKARQYRRAGELEKAEKVQEILQDDLKMELLCCELSEHYESHSLTMKLGFSFFDFVKFIFSNWGEITEWIDRIVVLFSEQDE